MSVDLPPLDQYDGIVFDCDGVLLDSNNFKSELFRVVLTEHGFTKDEVDRFSEYQKANFGISRYRLFEAVGEGRFGDSRGITVDSLLVAFGKLCRASYLDQAETPGMRDLLEKLNRKGSELYVVSGSDEDELRDVMISRGLSGYFAGIFGSPVTKKDNLKKVQLIIQKEAKDSAKLLFIGDAEADLEAALSVGADFIFMAAYSTVRGSLEAKVRSLNLPVIENLAELR
jgi:phosphoglycolate phosphatase-like HAD superfamily hydrolase